MTWAAPFASPNSHALPSRHAINEDITTQCHRLRLTTTKFRRNSTLCSFTLSPWTALLAGFAFLLFARRFLLGTMDETHLIIILFGLSFTVWVVLDAVRPVVLQALSVQL